MSQIVSLRLPDETARRLKMLAKRERRSVNYIGAATIEERLRMNEFTGIAFRGSGEFRCACLTNGPKVWTIIRVARGYDLDFDKTLKYFELPREMIRAAFNYYEVYGEEIDSILAEVDSMTFEDLKRDFPNIEVGPNPKRGRK